MENHFAEENAPAVRMAAFVPMAAIVSMAMLLTEKLKSERTDIFTEEISFRHLQVGSERR